MGFFPFGLGKLNTFVPQFAGKNRIRMKVGMPKIRKMRSNLVIITLNKWYLSMDLCHLESNLRKITLEAKDNKATNKILNIFVCFYFRNCELYNIGNRSERIINRRNG